MGKIDTSKDNKIFIEKFTPEDPECQDADGNIKMIEIEVPQTNGAPVTAVFIERCTGDKKAGTKRQVYIKLIGKAKTIAVVSCTDVCVVFDDVVTTCEITRCKKLTAQGNNTAGTFMVDKSDEITLRVPAASCTGEGKCCVYTSEANSVVVVVPDGEDEKEHGIPVTILSTFSEGKASHTIEGAITEA